MSSWAAVSVGNGENRPRYFSRLSTILAGALVTTILLGAALQRQLLQNSPRSVETYALDVGTLGDLRPTSWDSENVLGSLAIEQPKLSQQKKKEQHAINTFSTVAATLKNKVLHLSTIGKALRIDEAKVKALEKREQQKYWSALHQAQIIKRERKAVPQDEAEKVAKLVLGAIEPQLKKQQDEISSLRTFVKPSRHRMAAARFHKRVVPATESESKSLYRQMTNYLKNTFKKSTAAILNMVDYKMNNDLGQGGRDPGIGAEPTLNDVDNPKTTIPAPLGWKNTAVSWNSAPWKYPAAKGGPCSVAGACSHGSFQIRDPQYWRKRVLERYAWPVGDPDKPPGGLEFDNTTTVPPLAQQTVSDDVLLSQPIGEMVSASPSFVTPDIIPSLHASIPLLPSSDFVVAAIGQFTIEHGGLYSFCAPAGDQSVLFIDSKPVVDNCDSAPNAVDGTQPTQACGSVSLLSGTHLVRAVLFQGKNASSFSTTYSGPDNSNIPSDVPALSGWVIRTYKSSKRVWSQWYSAFCGEPKKYYLGDDELMSDLDDFLPPNDAYIHDQLTSGNYGFDHFGKLAPMSKENQQIMYGSDFQNSNKLIFGKRLHSTARGGAGKFSDKRSSLGDEQIDDDDREVPVQLANGEFKGEDHDHFDHWKWNSDLNQNLLNGMYWKHLKKDGMMDRLMPTNEAYAQRKGASHDRHPAADLLVGSWNLGDGPAIPSPVDILQTADTRLLSNMIGETVVSGVNFLGPTTIQQYIPNLPDQNFVAVETGNLVIKNSGTYTFCATSSDPGILFVDRSSVLFIDGTTSVNGTCADLNLLAGDHDAKVVLFQSTSTGTLEASYSGPDTLFNETYVSSVIPAQPGWLLHAYYSTPSAWSAWYTTYLDPAAALRSWAQQHPENWVKPRQETQGNNWRNKVFTGTHERIEGHQGVVSNNMQDGGATGGFTGAFF